MKLVEIKRQLLAKEMKRHEAVAALREHSEQYPNAAARRLQVRDWTREVNPERTEDSIKKQFMLRGISRRAAIVALGKLDKTVHPFATVKQWQKERGAEERAGKPATPRQGVKTGAKGKHEQAVA